VFIDYITLMLINMVAGLFLLADYVNRGLVSANQKQWIPGFGITGAIALTTGLHMVFTWPVRGSFNIAFGETTVLFGTLFIAAAIALALDWDLWTVAIYAFFAGLVAVVVGIRIINLSITRTPVLSGIGFILTGLGGIFAAPALYWKNHRIWRLIGPAVLIIAALIWAFTGYLAYWSHLESFQQWVPQPMR
jgi:putative membrane protein